MVNVMSETSAFGDTPLHPPAPHPGQLLLEKTGKPHLGELGGMLNSSIRGLGMKVNSPAHWYLFVSSKSRLIVLSCSSVHIHAQTVKKV
jgi:hypothetical protein